MGNTEATRSGKIFRYSTSYDSLMRLIKPFFLPSAHIAHHCCEWICAPLKLKNNILAEISSCSVPVWIQSFFMLHILSSSSVVQVSPFFLAAGESVSLTNDLLHISLFLHSNISFVLALHSLLSASGSRKVFNSLRAKKGDEKFQHSSCSRWE